mmetsp:Transcript_17779/g.28026  ORF Transcript_17779/g.28026 Transcript_17779/m.28026 type:complete len:94 (+) Transcript_17779:821-1102(+)
MALSVCNASYCALCGGQYGDQDAAHAHESDVSVSVSSMVREGFEIDVAYAALFADYRVDVEMVPVILIEPSAYYDWIDSPQSTVAKKLAATVA